VVVDVLAGAVEDTVEERVVDVLGSHATKSTLRDGGFAAGSIGQPLDRVGLTYFGAQLLYLVGVTRHVGMTETVFDVLLTTYTSVLLTATAVGVVKPVRVPVTVLVEVVITETVSLLVLTTYARVPSGLNATALAPLKPVRVSVTVLSEVRITVTVSPPTAYA
jgi:hypothetical protein